MTCTHKIRETLQNSFANQCKKVRENTGLMVAAIMQCDRVNTATIARKMSVINGLDFKANDKKIRRFLQLYTTYYPKNNNIQYLRIEALAICELWNY